MLDMKASRIMRTTLNIDAPLLEDLRRLQKEEKKPLGRIASELISEALTVGNMNALFAQKAL